MKRAIIVGALTSFVTVLCAAPAVMNNGYESSLPSGAQLTPFSSTVRTAHLIWGCFSVPRP